MGDTDTKMNRILKIILAVNLFVSLLAFDRYYFSGNFPGTSPSHPFYGIDWGPYHRYRFDGCIYALEFAIFGTFILEYAIWWPFLSWWCKAPPVPLALKGFCALGGTLGAIIITLMISTGHIARTLVGSVYRLDLAFGVYVCFSNLAYTLICCRKQTLTTPTPPTPGHSP